MSILDETKPASTDGVVSSDRAGSLENTASRVNSKNIYRPDIDGLRALAVISVVLYHAFPSLLPGGFTGVDIFFVISGYLISGHIVTSLSQGTFSFAGFYSRRIRRIFPALAAVMAASLVAGWFLLLQDEYTQLGKHTAAGASFLANFAYWREAGYFDNSGITKPLLHLWSLGIEEQFYIMWPALVFASWRAGQGGWKVIVTMAVLSLALSAWMTPQNPTAAFYSPATRVWELLFGAGLAEFERSRRVAPSTMQRNAASWSGAFLMLLALAFINENTLFPGLSALVPVVAATLLILGGPQAALNRTLLSSRVFVAMGLISYPLYLWHWPLLSFAHIVNSGTPDWILRATLVAAAVGLASLTYWCIERPVRFGRWRRAPVTLPLCAIMILIAITGGVIYLKNGLPQRDAAAEGVKLNSQFVGAAWPYASNENCMARYPFPEAAEYGWWFCMLEKDEPATVLLTGGSFANQLYPGLAHSHNLQKQNVLSIGTCRPLYVERNSTNGRKTGTPCTGPNFANQNAFIDSILASENSIETVVVDGLHANQDQDYIESAIRRIEQLEAYGVQVVVFLPHYKTHIDVRRCFPRPLATKYSCDIPQAEYDEFLSSNASLEAEIKNRLPNVLFFNQNRIFCKEDPCSLISDGLPLIRDEWQHISEYASEMIAAEFVRWAEQNYPQILDAGLDN